MELLSSFNVFRKILEEVTTASYLKNYLKLQDLFLILIYQKVRKMLNIIMILVEKRGKTYDIFLDKKHRQYSYGYWKNNTKTLEEAQQNKIDHIIKKLDIKDGSKVLDVGCGWGGMALNLPDRKDVKLLEYL